VSDKIENVNWYGSLIEKYIELNEEDKNFIEKGLNFAKNAPSQTGGNAF